MDFDCEKILTLLPVILECFANRKPNVREKIIELIGLEYSDRATEQEILSMQETLLLVAAAHDGNAEGVEASVAKIASLKAA